MAYGVKFTGILLVPGQATTEGQVVEVSFHCFGCSERVSGTLEFVFGSPCSQCAVTCDKCSFSTRGISEDAKDRPGRW